MSTTDDDAFEKTLLSMRPALKVAFQAGREVGFAEGFAAGQQLGYVDGINALRPAVSDGLRHGSPVCGRAMQGLRGLGLDTEPDQGD